MQQQWELSGLESLQSMTDWIRWAISRFNEAGLHYGHGTDNAMDDAYYLVTAGLHLPHEIPSYLLSSNLSTAEKQRLLQLIQRRVEQRVPTAYLVNQAWFAGLPFYVDESVLIPRSPIAELIASQFEPWIEADTVQRILDLCTGSGCIAIACAYAFPEAEVVATDIDSKALDIAARNARQLQVEERVQCCNADVFAGLESGGFDIIVSNPPYVDAPDMQQLPPEFRHEPHLALAAGEDGLDIVHRILAGAKDYLNDGGILIVEVGNSAEAVMQAYPNLAFTWLEFEHGGQGVFLLHKADLEAL